MESNTRVLTDQPRLRGAFFWLQEGSPLVGIEQPPSASGIDVADVVMFKKPRWWQLRRWVEAIRLLNALPTVGVGYRSWRSDGPHDHFLPTGPDESTEQWTDHWY